MKRMQEYIHVSVFTSWVQISFWVWNIHTGTVPDPNTVFMLENIFYSGFIL